MMSVPVKDDPRMWAISYEQLLSLNVRASRHFDSKYGHGSYKTKTMREINQEILIPFCRARNYETSYALGKNPKGLLLDVFVTHCWDEPFEDFVLSIKAAFHNHVEKPSLWICALALVQGAPERVARQLGTDADSPLSQAPFIKALQRADLFLVVRNKKQDLYTRSWCICELMFAKEFGLVPKKTRVTGPDKFSEESTSCENAKASTEKDRQRILNMLREKPNRVQEIDDLVGRFRRFPPNGPSRALFGLSHRTSVIVLICGIIFGVTGVTPFLKLEDKRTHTMDAAEELSAKLGRPVSKTVSIARTVESKNTDQLIDKTTFHSDNPRANRGGLKSISRSLPVGSIKLDKQVKPDIEESTHYTLMCVDDVTLTQDDYNDEEEQRKHVLVHSVRDYHEWFRKLHMFFYTDAGHRKWTSVGGLLLVTRSENPDLSYLLQLTAREDFSRDFRQGPRKDFLVGKLIVSSPSATVPFNTIEISLFKPAPRHVGGFWQEDRKTMTSFFLSNDIIDPWIQEAKREYDSFLQSLQLQPYRRKAEFPNEKQYDEIATKMWSDHSEEMQRVLKQNRERYKESVRLELSRDRERVVRRFVDLNDWGKMLADLMGDPEGDDSEVRRTGGVLLFTSCYHPDEVYESVAQEWQRHFIFGEILASNASVDGSMLEDQLQQDMITTPCIVLLSFDSLGIAAGSLQLQMRQLEGRMSKQEVTDFLRGSLS